MGKRRRSKSLSLSGAQSRLLDRIRIILFHLFGGKVLRFSDLERAIPAISQKMLIQQLRQMEKDGVVRRVVHHQVPPKVEYGLTDWGQALCPALDALLTWSARREIQSASADEVSRKT
jgi:DNA-binding HxlR family transcriptional regulator